MKNKDLESKIAQLRESKEKILYYSTKMKSIYAKLDAFIDEYSQLLHQHTLFSETNRSWVLEMDIGVELFWIRDCEQEIDWYKMLYLDQLRDL